MANNNTTDTRREPTSRPTSPHASQETCTEASPSPALTAPRTSDEPSEGYTPDTDHGFASITNPVRNNSIYGGHLIKSQGHCSSGGGRVDSRSQTISCKTAAAESVLLPKHRTLRPRSLRNVSGGSDRSGYGISKASLAGFGTRGLRSTRSGRLTTRGRQNVHRSKLKA